MAEDYSDTQTRLEDITLESLQGQDRETQLQSLRTLWGSTDDSHKAVVRALSVETEYKEVNIPGEGIYESGSEWRDVPTALAILASNVIQGSVRRATPLAPRRSSSASTLPDMKLANDPTHW
ncbi:MAG: hypothetical protein ACI9QC_000929 [Oceanicoccus sp.]|jgi:hypothetical protein